MNELREPIPQYPIPKELRTALWAFHFKSKVDPISYSKNETLFLETLNSLKNFDKINIYAKDYIKMLKLGLFIEQFHCEKELRKISYKLKLGKIKKPSDNGSKEYFIAQIHNINEIEKNISEAEIQTDSTKFVFNVESIEREKLILSKAIKNNELEFDTQKLSKIKFRFNPYPYNCCHFILDNLNQEIIKNRLNPTKFECEDLASGYLEIKNWINGNIDNNIEQKQAINNIINRSSYPAPFILYGPPGTGKTSTIIETILQLIKNNICNLDNKILICTPSNAAADVITDKLIKNGMGKELIRLYAKTRYSSIKKEILPYCNIIHKDVEPIKLVRDKIITICTLCYCARLTM